MGTVLDGQGASNGFHIQLLLSNMPVGGGASVRKKVVGGSLQVEKPAGKGIGKRFFVFRVGKRRASGGAVTEGKGSNYSKVQVVKGSEKRTRGSLLLLN